MAAPESPPHRIRELMDQRELSLQGLADLIPGVNKSQVHRVVRGETVLDIVWMRRIAAALGVKPSVLLLDEDVDIRPDDLDRQILETLAVVPQEDRATLVRIAADMVRLVKRLAAERPLEGNPEQIGKLADIWNSLEPAQRDRALAIIDAVLAFPTTEDLRRRAA